jgi:hypothetical protein
VYFYLLFNFIVQRQHKLSKRKFTNKKKLNFYFKKKFNNIYSGFSKQGFRFGNSALLNSNPIVLSSLFIFRFILLLKKIARKRDKTFRFFWWPRGSFITITKQSKGARMGKGKGKHLFAVQRYSPLIHFVEFFGVRSGRLLYFLNFFNTRFYSSFFFKLKESSFFSRSVGFNYSEILGFLK